MRYITPLNRISEQNSCRSCHAASRVDNELRRCRTLLMTLWPISDEVTVQIMNDFYDAAHNSGNAPKALAEVQRNWLLKLRSEKGLAQAVNLAGPFIMSSQGKPFGEYPAWRYKAKFYP
jgi:hypothetical protein